MLVQELYQVNDQLAAAENRNNPGADEKTGIKAKGSEGKGATVAKEKGVLKSVTREQRKCEIKVQLNDAPAKEKPSVLKAASIASDATKETEEPKVKLIPPSPLSTLLDTFVLKKCGISSTCSRTVLEWRLAFATMNCGVNGQYFRGSNGAICDCNTGYVLQLDGRTLLALSLSLSLPLPLSPSPPLPLSPSPSLPLSPSTPLPLPLYPSLPLSPSPSLSLSPPSPSLLPLFLPLSSLSFSLSPPSLSPPTDTRFFLSLSTFHLPTVV
ncbi:unnamed protein product [Closterium sp. NIES-64]|nr:unnamed protein product [Closterium sp. NIES-64]